MAKKKTAEKAKIEAAPVLRAGGGGGGPAITKSYLMRDDWKDKSIVNYVAFKSVGGEVQDLTVNGEPAGGGGGGDFSTAQLTINGVVELDVAWCSSDPEDGSSTYGHINDSGTYTVILFKGNAFINATSVHGNITINGNIEEVDDKMYNVTGNCTITVTP